MRIDFNTEGGPLLLATLDGAARWGGASSGSGESVVELVGQGVLELPAALQAVTPGDRKKPRQQRVFASGDEAAAFAARVIAALQAKHPGAARPPQYPDHPGFYLDGKRVFSVELKQQTDYDELCARMRGPVYQHRGLRLFVENEPGPGAIGFDPERAVVAVAGALQGTPDSGSLAAAAGALLRARPRHRLTLAGPLAIFSAAFSGEQIARSTFGAGFEAARPGPLLLPDQAPPGGALLAVPPGDYQLRYQGFCALGEACAEHFFTLSRG